MDDKNELSIDSLISEEVEEVIEDIAGHYLCSSEKPMELSIRFVEAIVERLSADLVTMRAKQAEEGQDHHG